MRWLGPVLVLACCSEQCLAADQVWTPPRRIDCLVEKRPPAYTIKATVDGIPLAFASDPSGMVPERAKRMRIGTLAARVKCEVLGRRFVGCDLLDETPPHVGFGSAALVVMQLATTPVGYKPVRRDDTVQLVAEVTAFVSDPGDHTLIPCPAAHP